MTDIQVPNSSSKVILFSYLKNNITCIGIVLHHNHLNAVSNNAIKKHSTYWLQPQWTWKYETFALNWKRNMFYRKMYNQHVGHLICILKLSDRVLDANGKWAALTFKPWITLNRKSPWKHFSSTPAVALGITGPQELLLPLHAPHQDLCMTSIRGFSL